MSRTMPRATVWAFGSRVTGKAKPHSDLDLAIEADGVSDKALLRRLKEAFEESDLPFRVDVVDLNAVSEEFRELVRREAAPLAKLREVVDR